MKNLIVALLVTLLLVAITNLLASLGLIKLGSAGEEAGNEYKVLSVEQMDDLGFRSVAKEEGIDVSEKGEITFPKEMVDKIAKVNLLPRTISEIETDGGWEFVAVTGDNFFIFRRAK